MFWLYQESPKKLILPLAIKEALNFMDENKYGWDFQFKNTAPKGSVFFENEVLLIEEVIQIVLNSTL